MNISTAFSDPTEYPTEYHTTSTNFTNTTLYPPNNSSSTTAAPTIVPVGIIKAAAVTVLIIFAIFGNLLVCISFALFRNLRSLTNYFILSLSIADLLSAFFVMPIWFGAQLYNSKWPSYRDQPTIVIFWHCIDLFLTMAGILSLSAISVERNLAITNPFCYTKWLSPRRVLIAIACLWVFSLTVALTTVFRVIKDGRDRALFVVSVAYILPFIVLFTMYAKIFIVARRQARRLRQDGAFATDLKAMKTIAIVVGAYLVCYTPNFFIIIWAQFRLEPALQADTVSVARWLTYLNSSLNPLIYSYFNKTYRKAFKRLFKNWGDSVREYRRENSNKMSTAPRTMQSRMSLNTTMRSSAGSLLDAPKTGGDVISLDDQLRSTVNRNSQVSVNGVLKASDNLKKLVEEPRQEVAETSN